jgi:hypothetical protein
MERVIVESDVLWERVNDEVIVTNRGNGAAFKLSSDVAEEFLAIATGSQRVTDQVAREELLSLGLITVPGSSGRLSRRNLVLGSSAGLGASVLALSLPAAAAASSHATTSGGGDSSTFTVPDGFFTHLFVTLSDFTGLEIMNQLPKSLLEISTDLFVIGEEWTFTVGPFDDGGGTQTKTAVVTEATAPRTFLRILIDTPTDVFASTILEGRLSRGSERSNLFKIPRLSVG